MDEILNASLALFSRKGYLRTSLVEIAEEVGITKGGIYHYIEKKEDLLLLIHQQMVDAFVERFQSASDPNDDPKTRLLKWINAHLGLMRDYKAHIKIFFTELYNLEKQSDLNHIVERRDQIYVMLYDIIKDGMKKKQFRNDVNPKIITFLLFGMLNWFYQWYQPHGPRSLEKINEDVVTFVTGGLLSPN